MKSNGGRPHFSYLMVQLVSEHRDSFYWVSPDTVRKVANEADDHKRHETIVMEGVSCDSTPGEIDLYHDSGPNAVADWATNQKAWLEFSGAVMYNMAALQRLLATEWANMLSGVEIIEVLLREPPLVEAGREKLIAELGAFTSSGSCDDFIRLCGKYGIKEDAARAIYQEVEEATS